MSFNCVEGNGYAPGVDEDQKTLALFAEVESYISGKIEGVEPYSLEEYFLMLLGEGLKTRQLGNYGIAASLVVRHQGVELIVFGRNTVFSENDPHGHAEMNAIKNARKALVDNSGETMRQMMEEGDLIMRQSPHKQNERFLLTTLEPCPMCTVGSVLNSDVKKVVIGTEDEFAGAILNGRLKDLAPLWNSTGEIQSLEIITAQSNSEADKDTYVPLEMRDLLNRLFFDTKERLDQKLDKEGFIDLQRLGLLAQGLVYGKPDLS